MRFTPKPISLALALAMLGGQLALCQEPPSLPRLPRQEPAAAPAPAPTDTSAAPEAADTPAENEAPVSLPAAPADSMKTPAQPAKPDSAQAKQSPAFGTWKPGDIRIDRNGRIFLAVSAALLGGMYLAYLYFRKDAR